MVNTARSVSSTDCVHTDAEIMRRGDRAARPLTTRQKDVLRFVIRYTREHGYPPNLREIGNGIGGSANQATAASRAGQHLVRIEKKGYVRVASKLSRGITVLMDEDGHDPAVGPTGTVIPRGECFDCGAALFGVADCPMCAMGISRRAS